VCLRCYAMKALASIAEELSEEERRRVLRVAADDMLDYRMDVCRPIKRVLVKLRDNIGEGIERQILENLESESGEVRCSALGVIQALEIQNCRIMEMLGAMLDDGDDAVLERVVDSLTKYGTSVSEETIRKAIRCLGHESHAVRYAAREMLIQVRSKIPDGDIRMIMGILTEETTDVLRSLYEEGRLSEAAQEPG